MTLPLLDLDGCSTEPIRVPGAIQPHGWMLVYDPASGGLVAYSDNCGQLSPASGAALTAALQLIVDGLRARVPPGTWEGAPVSVGLAVIGDRSFDTTFALAGPYAFLELEPATQQSGTQGSIYSLARRFVPALQKASSVLEIATLAAVEMKRLTGMGRCLVYAFNGEGHGKVLAESADDGYESYAGHSFPASDVPLQARELYLLNHIRLIPDANYRPSALTFVDPAAAAVAIDLSFAQLRSVSPVHLEYMRNMGTLASMSVSIVVRGRLWGLISCHNHAPRGLDLETRFSCEHLGRLISLQIEAKEDNATVAMRERLRGLTLQLVAAMDHGDATLRGIVNESALLLGVAGASGAAIVFNEQCWQVGATPADDHILAMADWVAGLGLDTYHSESLVADGVPLAQVVANATGVLAVSLSRVHRHVLLWFRPELVRTVVWAGAANKDVDEQGRLHPRRSFKSWEETQRGCCAPWLASEVAAVTDLRKALLGVVLHRAQERDAAARRLGRVTLAKDLAEQANSAKTHFLAVLSHELRTPLASIANAATLIERHATMPEKFASLVPMIKRNVAIEARLIDDLLDLSAVAAGKLNLSVEPIDMDALVDQVAEMMRHDLAAKDIDFVFVPGTRVVRVAVDPVRMQQVVWNIIRNAVKFTPRGGRIRIHNTIDGNDFVLTCTDSGVGIEAAALARIFVAYEQANTDTYQRYGGLGLGLAISMGIVEGHGGKLAAASGGPDKGATFTFRLPLSGQRHNPVALLGK